MADAGGRRTFVPVVLLGLGLGVLTAVASNKTWVGLDSQSARSGALALGPDGKMPLATALSLVVLAAWGVLLVTRGVVRRALAVLGLLAALGVVATVVVGHQTLPGDVRDGVTNLGTADVAVHFTAWFWVGAVCALGSVAATVLAVRLVPTWPEMGSRYDAPGSTGRTPSEDPESNLDLWRAIDEGRDPTV